MRVSFRRFPGHSSAYSVIERDDGVVYRMKEFTRAGTRLPHDLRHFVVERELGIADGIWGGIAAGMVYTSMDHVQGRRPPHSAERSDELQRARRQQLMRAELLANLVEAIAMLDGPSGDDIRRLTRTKLSAVPVTAAGRDHVPGSLDGMDHRSALTAAARSQTPADPTSGTNGGPRRFRGDAPPRPVRPGRHAQLRSPLAAGARAHAC